MTMEEAIKKIIQQYWADESDEDTSALHKVSPTKYNKKYFDTFEKEKFGEKDVIKDKKYANAS